MTIREQRFYYAVQDWFLGPSLQTVKIERDNNDPFYILYFWP